VLIKPTDRTIKAVLEGGFYKIPRFQRPYSWDQENVDDFWSDAITNTEPDYFIGSFVVYPENATSDVSMVVDGQQRLTTATIMLATIRNAFDELGDAALASGVQSLIERADVNNEKRYVLRTETSYPYFHEYVQKHGTPQLPKSVGREEQAIETAYKYLTKQVQGALRAIDDDPSIAPQQKAPRKRQKLLQLRDNVLRLQLISVELQSEDEAYIIFETLNTRGKDLGIADLVKNLVARLLKPANKGVDVAKDKWASILQEFDESAADIDANAFIYHSWISRHQYAGREKLFRRIKSEVTSGTVATILDQLVLDSKLYRQCLEPDSTKWTKQESELREALRALALFKVAQPLPMMLALLRAYRAADITLRMMRETLRAMENFHVQFTALTAQRTGGGTAKMYAAAAQELSKAKTKQKRANVLKAFKLKLRARVPSYAEFEAGFAQLEFLSTNTKQKPVVQYLLQRLDQHQRKTAPVDYAKMSIEHIAPENPLAGASSEASVGRIGNLLLLDEKANSKVGNKSFAAKKAIYRTAPTPIDDVLDKASQWTSKEIDRRTQVLAKLAYQQVFRV
jgi:hypothetical protein